MQNDNNQQEVTVTKIDDLKAMLSKDAIFINTAFGQLIDKNIKIIFAEQVQTTEGFIKAPRFAIIISQQTLEEFAGMFVGMIQNLAKHQEQQAATPKEEREDIDDAVLH